MTSKDHWKRVYAANPPDEVSWYQPTPARSLELIRRTGIGRDARIIDVGGGTSFLVDELLAAGFRRVGVLDHTEEPLKLVERRLGAAAANVEFIVADVTEYEPDRTWDLWHDRAVFHFLVEEQARVGYRRALRRGLAAGGHAVVATFGLAGPPKCSGLPVARYDARTLRAALGGELELRVGCEEDHRTPSGAVQQFLYCWFTLPEAKETS